MTIPDGNFTSRRNYRPSAQACQAAFPTSMRTSVVVPSMFSWRALRSIFKILRIFIGPSHEVFVGSEFARSVRQLACPSGARREGRTPTLLREPDFESGASASSAIRAGSCSGKFPALVTRSPEAVNQRVALFSSRPIRCYNGGPSVEHRFSYDRDQEGREHG